MDTYNSLDEFSRKLYDVFKNSFDNIDYTLTFDKIPKIIINAPNKEFGDIRILLNQGYEVTVYIGKYHHIHIGRDFPEEITSEESQHIINNLIKCIKEIVTNKKAVVIKLKNGVPTASALCDIDKVDEIENLFVEEPSAIIRKYLWSSGSKVL